MSSNALHLVCPHRVPTSVITVLRDRVERQSEPQGSIPPAGAQHEQGGVFEEQLGVGRASEPAFASWVVLPAGLDRVVRQMHLVVIFHVFAEHEG